MKFRSERLVERLLPRPPLSVSLRRFPYPYRAGLAISNDADLMTGDSFRFFHRFLNTARETPLGGGLGLPVGDSFFLFRSKESPSTLSYFEGLSGRLGVNAPLIRDCARAGLMDSLHTYGDFLSPGDFSRDLARRGLAALEHEGIHIKVWVNHGTTNNVQNFGVPEMAQFRGDAVGDPAYHADLALEYGIRYCWFGNELSQWVGHDSVRSVRTSLERTAARLWARMRRRLSPSNWDTGPLVRPIRLRDGQSVLNFQRFVGPSGTTPTVEDLALQLSTHNLRRLVSREGCAIVYQHLGVRRKKAGFGIDSYEPNRPPYLNPQEAGALRRLADEYRGGRLFVTTTARLLRYNVVRNGLCWAAEGDSGRIKTILSGVIEPGGVRRLLEPSELEGLTFYTDRPGETDLYLSTTGQPVRIGGLNVNPPDYTGRASVTIAVHPPHYPDVG